MIKKILVIGGGTAGWLSALYLMKCYSGLAEVCLVESDKVVPLGVGEATVPSIVQTLKLLGLDEKAFMRKTNATFKSAIRFDGWNTGDPINDTYWHAFGTPVAVKGQPIAPYWLEDVLTGSTEESFVDYSMIEAALLHHCRAPKSLNHADFEGPFSYAYHFDATLLALYLKEVSLTLGVKQMLGDVESVSLDSASGMINSLSLQGGLQLQADLYVDCTGFSSVIIEQGLGEPWVDKSDYLFCDKALVVQQPSLNLPKIPTYTVSTAQRFGWIWDIPLTNRRGLGYVYSSNHTTEDQIAADLAGYLRMPESTLNMRSLNMKSGYRQKPWRKNCLAIGLSAGFAEPLESTGILSIEIALSRFTQLSNLDMDNDIERHNFNQSMMQFYESIFDFIKLHYFISQRKDSEFWLDNQASKTCSDKLLNRLISWKIRPPVVSDLSNLMEPFNIHNYQQVLFGMKRLPANAEGLSRWDDHTQAAKLTVNAVKTLGQKAKNEFPSHRSYLKML